MSGHDKAETLILNEISNHKDGLSLGDVLSTEDEKLDRYLGVGINVIDIIEKFLYFGQLEYQAKTGKFVYVGSKSALEEKMAGIA